ncbi:MAG TPA: MBL fold metallo-hydrolase [Thermoanaerobaculia bacterium]|nr:MBL fold metallo-hydrolase [Thermoanaerobaculia bacterium]
MKPQTLRFGDLRLTGTSLAGVETWLRVHPSGVAFDVGRGDLRLAGSRHLFVTHGHLDHALGVPYVLSQRSLHRTEGTTVHCPAATAADLAAFIEAAARLERAHYDYELVGHEPGDRVAVGKGLSVETFRTDHVVPSLGYHLLRRRRHLRPDLAGSTQEELRTRREAGEEITEESEQLALSYCGDTGAKVFELEPRIFTSQVLVIECTFLGDGLRDKGRRFKHLHVDDLAAVAERFDNRALVLMHLSQRHRPSELLAAAEEKLPAMAGRVHVLCEGWQGGDDHGGGDEGEEGDDEEAEG